MTVNSEQIRTAILPYLSEAIALPGNLLDLLEDADEGARKLAESIEGLLGLYAANLISEASVKEQIRSIVTADYETTSSPKKAADFRFVLLKGTYAPNLPWPPSQSGSLYPALAPVDTNTSTHANIHSLVS